MLITIISIAIGNRTLLYCNKNKKYNYSVFTLLAGVLLVVVPSDIGSNVCHFPYKKKRCMPC
ncbi:MAG TPA: hypothetical protein PLV62_13560, partial [Spirochaetota bacterium]|nr:hypothetical protein [Spirochaetota bacterium]HPD04514.1 hypothetical protein [Spirochaetota bacterium]HPK46002.1 hypothetical protein [Spirochaetota bacterium]HQG42015.1 hypothetical protein [Spirochaetota bacterium]HRR61047.1 hypothetical protein [Spirochaetota bacterium]